MESEEYKIIREEIMFYLDKNQAVRNMMYATTAAFIGFIANASQQSAFLYLLPLIIIIPSFIVSQDYLDNIYRAATYLKVFYEDDNKTDFRWETRIRKFNNATKRGIKVHRFPYECTTIACIILYLVNDINTMLLKVTVTSICFIICMFIFVLYREINEIDYIDEWKRVKKEENK